MCCCLVLHSCSVSNIALHMSIYVSFMCSLSLLILCIRYFSKVFMCFSVFIMFIVSVIHPYVCPVFSMWFGYPELLLLFLIACICS
jgi:hypothetical protein